MEVGTVEEVATALGDPNCLGGALALGAVAVAAGAVADAPVPAAVALLDLAAEGGGAAALDGGHDAALQGAQGAPGARAEGLPVAAEDVRDFESRAGHRSPARFCAGGLRAGQQVERAGRGADLGAGDLQVAGGGGEAAMAEQQLDGADVDAGFKQVDGEAVTKHVGVMGLAMPDRRRAFAQAALTA